MFQTVRDEGAWRFPYPRLHSHAWTDAVIGAASLFFTGVSFLLAWLIAGLFDLIGIELLEDALNEGWFAWMLAGFAFGAAFGLLRERDRLVATLQRLVMVVLSVLAPVLAFALLAFLLSIPFTGLQGLWDSWVSAAGLLLTASAGAILLANAVIGDRPEHRSPSVVLRWSALALVAVVVPLAVLAGVAMGIRIGEYGWTPERIWGAIAVGVAIAYGLGGWWSIWRGRRAFDQPLRPIQTSLAIGLCGVALFLALPILDFGAISARSQLARLESGRAAPAEFDWAAMAFDFGPAGRHALKRMQVNGPPDQRAAATTALKATNRWDLSEESLAAGPPPTEVTVVPRGAPLPPDLRAQLLGGPQVKDPFCSEGGACRVFPQPGGTTFVVFMDRCASLPPARRNRPNARCSVSPAVYERRNGQWVNVYDRATAAPTDPSLAPDEQVASLKRESDALDRGNVSVATVTRRQVVVGGKPTGHMFE